MSPYIKKTTKHDSSNDKIASKLSDCFIGSPKRAREDDDIADSVAQCSKSDDVDLVAARELYESELLEFENEINEATQQEDINEDLEFLSEDITIPTPHEPSNIASRSNMTPINGAPDAIAEIPSKGPTIRPVLRDNNLPNTYGIPVVQPNHSTDAPSTSRASLTRTRPNPYNIFGTTSRPSLNPGPTSANTSRIGPSNPVISTYNLVLHPIDYWNQNGPVVSVNDRNNIIRYINDNLKARDGRNQLVTISIDKNIYRNGVIVFKLDDPISQRWIRVMMENFNREELNYAFSLTSEASFRFIPAFTGWTPDGDATFERFVRVAAAAMSVDSSSWRFVRLIDENKNRGATGKKFLFLDENLQRFLVNGVLRFKYDANPQRAVIKLSSGPSIADNPNSNKRMDQILQANSNQDAFDDLLRSEPAGDAMDF